MRYPIAILATLGAFCSSTIADAQDLRTLQVARELSDTAPLVVDVAFGAGKFNLHSVEGRLLYQMRLRYNENATDAVHLYDPDNHTLTLGLNRDSGHFGFSALRGGSHDNGSELSIGLSGLVPIDLRVKVAGTETTLDLAGLKLTKLEVNCAATGATLNFSAPNRAEMESMTLQFAGAGAEIHNLGNANAKTVMIHGAAGGLDLDFGSTLMRDMTIRADLAFGGMQIALPRDVGLMVRSRSRLGSFDAGTLKKIGDAWYSENWNDASRKVTIESSTFVGSFELTRTGH